MANEVESLYQEAPDDPDEVQNSAEKTFTILRIDSEPEDEVLRATLIPSDLNTDVEYYAISYAWGSREQTSTIYVNDKTVAVTPHLEAALKQVSLSLKTKFLWVDCLSIDQDDPIEKARQVANMHLIFAGAKCVAVWLGVADTSSEKVMKFILDNSQSLRSSSDRSDVMFATPIATPWLTLLLFDQALVEAVFRLSEREWFRRLWCIQEMILARKVVFVCGPSVVEDEVFCSFSDGILASQPMLMSTWHLRFTQGAVSVQEMHDRLE